ncbi:HK97 family phage prohead protease [Candidatus Kaiserbacteria bacterium]|nr:HK97 family phage prohead protease [Candidatus Kaiserbacteria bacterium]
MINSFPLEVRAIGDTGTFEGYASVFDVVDSYATAMAPGAFAVSLNDWKARGKYPPILWQHKADEPIGTYSSMVEDPRGLHVTGQLLIKDDPTAKRAHAHLRAGSINGLSIGFIRDDSEYDAERDIELIKAARLVEVSLVTFPSNPSATVTAVRNKFDDGELPSPKDIELILRDAGFSRRQAKTLMAAGYSALSPRDAELKALNEILETVNRWKLKNEH